MSTTILCQTKRAGVPYYIEEVDLKIGSLEELCYFLQNNLPLVDLNFFNMNLLDWIETELETPRLAAELYRVLRDNPDPQLPDLIMPVMREAGWLSKEEERQTAEDLRSRDTAPVAARLKDKADALVLYKKYVQAIRTYDTVLKLRQTEKLGSAFEGSLWYNRGVAYARLFQYREAASCMRKAHEEVRTMQTLKGLLFCVRQAEGEESMLREAKKWEVDDTTMETLTREIDAAMVAEAPEDPEAAMQTWIREYQRETRP